MITYELAKKLKEAGLGKSTWPNSCVMYENGKMICGWAEPTLSELIEACGDRFGQLVKAADLQLWQSFCKDFAEAGVDKLLGSGHTPEESVANLWLSLNNKNANDYI